ncbi:DUF4011 domain-containing protein [Picosynechococcus sp. NKBG15041c]|uniref:DUF4011 domain-containing protein n=1 Tax=Picosynechococcus sp. NKBG15041c TaxID=1407650 RepID=UPI0004273582|nr:DUF4011 domain-containing protein [Picosynechococcus sp. NKBG15041c]
MQKLSLQLNFETAVNYNLLVEHIGNPLITSVQLENQGEFALHELELEIKLLSGNQNTWRMPLPMLSGGQALEINDIRFRIGSDLLQQIVEDDVFSLQLTISQQEKTLIQQTQEVEIKAYNTISWSRDPKASYACFITPNHPVIPQILKQTSKKLLSQNLKGSLEGYQAESTQRVREMTQALYEAFADFDISYTDPPAGVWSGGQRIRLPDQVLTEKLGTCADLTPLAASCLEQIGLYPIIIFLKGHVLPGVFLLEELPQKLPAIIEDIGQIKHLIGLGTLLIFDSSTYAKQPQPPFSEAVNRANEYLEKFEYAINVYQARRNGFTPLPVRMKVAVDKDEEVLSIAQQILRDAAKNLTNEGDNQTTSQESSTEPLNAVVASRLQSWKEKLLDLSSRNRLLHLSNLDFSNLYSQAFIDAARNSLVMLANVIADENSEATEYIIDLASTLETNDLLIKDFSFERQSNLNFYFSKLLELIQISLPESFIENDLKPRIIHSIQKADEKLIKNLKKGKASFIFLYTPPELLGNLEDQIASGRSLELIPGGEYTSGAEAIALATKELTQGYCQTRLVLGADSPMPESLLFEAGRTLAKVARIAEEETGASPLYLAFGLLQWCEEKSSVPRLAPIFLYPIEIKVDSRKRRISINRTKGEAVGNITLVEKLKRNCDIDLSHLVQLPEDENGVDLEKVFNNIRQAILAKPGWKVIETAVITSFTFGKFLLWKDLQDNTEQLLKNKLVHYIASAGRESFSDPLSNFDIKSLDQEPYQDLPLVVDADSSQLAAVYAALKGRSFILQGPPGTGKSQTITNIIAACIAAGKTVLFVAEKQAAVEVVYRRLTSVGLGPFCLDLHSQSNRLEVSASFDEALQQKKEFDQVLQHKKEQEANWNDFGEQLESLREQLRKYTDALHRPHKIGFSLFDALNEQVKLSPLQSSLKLPPEIQVKNLTAKDLQSQIQKIQDFVKVVQKGEDCNLNPWSFISAINWSFSLDQQLESQLPDARDKIKQLMLCIQNYFPNLAHKLNWEKCLSLATIADFTSLKTLPVKLNKPSEWKGFKQTTQKWLENVDELNQCQRELSQFWKQEIFNQDLKKLEKKSESLLSAFILMRWIGGFFFRRQVQQWYKGKTPGLKELYRKIRSLQGVVQLRQEIDDDRKSIEQHLTTWNGEAKQLTALVDEYQAIFSSLESFQDEDLSLDKLTQIQTEYWTALKQKIDAAKESFGILQNALEIEEFPPSSQRHSSFDAIFQWLEDLTRNRKKLYAWSQYSQIKTEFINSSIGSILEWLESETIPLEELASTYKAVVLKVWFQESFDAEEVLQDFNVDRHNITIQNFQKLEKDYLELSRRFVRAKVLSRVPNLDPSLKGSEAAELSRDITKKQKHLPVRTFFQKNPQSFATSKTLSVDEPNFCRPVFASR